MLYKCDNCNYTTKRLSDLRRHQNKKRPCNNKTEVNADNLTEVSNLNANVTNCNANIEIIDNNTQNMNTNSNSKIYTCSKCQKQFNRRDRFRNHESKCDGLDSKQCKICLKMFTTYQGKYQHNKYVKCSPPLPQQQPHTINNNITNNNNNIDNRVDNSTHNIQNNNIKLTLNFGNEDLSGLISDPNYMNNVEDQIQSFISQLPYLNEDAGKIIISEITKKIYFNKEYPQNQTIKKTCKKDNMVKIFQNDEWKPQMVEDVFKRMSSKVEQYFSPYFETLYDKYESLTKEQLSGEDKHIITNSRGFGNRMVWFNWDDIIHPIIKINEVINKSLQIPDIEDEDFSNEKDLRLQNRILKNTIKCLSQQLYENTKNELIKF